MNTEDSKQFDEIMGRTFTPEEKSNVENTAHLENAYYKMSAIFGGPKNEDEERVNNSAIKLSRMRKFPAVMVRQKDDHEHEVFYPSHTGWTHTWDGGSYIEHHHPKFGVVDATNLHNYNKPDNQVYENGNMTPATFLNHVNEFEKNIPVNYPKDFRP